jgi:hypothetical protein
MPPRSKTRPDTAQLEKALGSLKKQLRQTNLAAQERNGRVPSRQLTRLEYEYTIRELLSTEGDFATILPAESDSGSFDTVGSSQRISAVHMQGYLEAADRALDAAIRLNANPFRRHVFDYSRSRFLNEFHDKALNLGGNMSRELKDGVAVFRDLDNTSVLFGSNLGNANAHHARNLPIFLAGGGFKHGRYVAHDKDDNTPLCNLFVTMPNNMEIETESFGQSTGALSW